MDRKQMYQTLEARKNEYRSRHPATAEMDLQICKMFCSGKNAVQISMSLPCSESTVYRAINRIRKFIHWTNSDRFMEALRECISKYDPTFGDGNVRSVLEMLHIAYGRFNHFESPESKAGYTELYSKLSSLSLQSTDQIIDIVSSLCHSYERDGFTEGVKLGVKLGEELTS